MTTVRWNVAARGFVAPRTLATSLSTIPRRKAESLKGIEYLTRISCRRHKLRGSRRQPCVTITGSIDHSESSEIKITEAGARTPLDGYTLAATGPLGTRHGDP